MQDQIEYAEDSLFRQLPIENQLELLTLENTPLHPPRECTPGEGIYLGLWQEYVQEDPGRLPMILNDTVQNINQRMVSVCASFMVWMGCNDGRDFTGKAQELARRHDEDRVLGNYISEQVSYLMAWAAHNTRVRGSNGGVRTIEAMLHPTDCHYTKGAFGRIVYHWEEFEKITPHDIDTVECMVRWWSSDDAKLIRRAAVPQILIKSREMLARMGHG